MTGFGAMSGVGTIEAMTPMGDPFLDGTNGNVSGVLNMSGSVIPTAVNSLANH